MVDGFGETSIGLDGVAMLFNGVMMTKQLLVPIEGQCVLERQPWESME